MLKKIQKIVLYSLLAYAILGFIILPLILKSQLTDIVGNETNPKISVDNISFNPFIFKLKLNDIELRDTEDSHLLSLKSLAVNLEVYSLLNSTLHIKNLMNIELLEEIYIGLAPQKNLEKMKKKLEKTYKGDALKPVYLKALIKE